jgi:hypothetical protein
VTQVVQMQLLGYAGLVRCRSLDAIALEARARGDQWVRLNCWTTNTLLHAYYEANGYEHIRTVDVPGRMSGALFQRPAPQ